MKWVFIFSGQKNFKMKKINASFSVSFLFTFLICFSGTAQPEIIELKWAHYKKGGEKYYFGLLDKNLKAEMAVSPRAVIEFQKYEKKRNNFYLLYGIGTVLTVTGFFIDSKNSGFDSGFGNNWKKDLVLSGGLAFVIWSIPVGFESLKIRKNAVRIRNEDVLRMN